MLVDKTVPHRRDSSTTSHRTTKQAQKQPETPSEKPPEKPASSRKSREFTRGVLRRVVERVVDPEAQKQHCVLSCGHRVTRSSGQNSDRCYCSECDPAVEAKKRKKRERLRLGAAVGRTRKR